MYMIFEGGDTSVKMLPPGNSMKYTK